MDQVKASDKVRTKNRSLLPDDMLKSLPSNNPGLVAVVRAPDLKVFYVNTQFNDYLGYTNDDVSTTGLSFGDLLEEYQYEHLLNQLNSVKHNQIARSTYVIYRIKGKSGKTAPFYLYASPIKESNAEHGELYYILMHPDVSKWGMPFTSFDSKELFLEQFKSEEFGTFEWTLDVDIIFWSAGLYKLYEIPETRVTNMLMESFVHPDDRQRLTDQMKNALETGVDLNIEYRIITEKQNIKVLHCLARLIKGEDGVAVKFAGSIRDVTEQRKIEEDLKNKVEELYHSNKELEEFAYIASHDLQEPLRKITTFSDRLSDKYKNVLAGDGAMYLSRMVASAENMRSLINDLLEFSRISKTAQPFERINLNLVLREVKNEFEVTIEDTKTVIQSDELPVIEAIGSQMKQLFSNIISNAIKFHRPDVAPLITIKTSVLTNKEKLTLELDKNITYHKVEIADNGIGFEPEYATRIFQVFQRLHGKSEYPGTGIGLAICKKILEYHHGSISAESNPGEGARFTFILPQEQSQKGNKL